MTTRHKKMACIVGLAVGAVMVAIPALSLALAWHMLDAPETSSNVLAAIVPLIIFLMTGSAGITGLFILTVSIVALIKIRSEEVAGDARETG